MAREAQETKLNINKQNSIKRQNFCVMQEESNALKAQHGEKYLEAMHATMGFYAKYTRNSDNSVRRKNIQS